GVKLDPAIKATARLAGVASPGILSPAPPRPDILGVLRPACASATSEIASELAPNVRRGHAVVICSKGIEQATGMLPSQIVAELMPEVTVAVLSGPSSAARIAIYIPPAG